MHHKFSPLSTNTGTCCDICHLNRRPQHDLSILSWLSPLLFPLLLSPSSLSSSSPLASSLCFLYQYLLSKWPQPVPYTKDSNLYLTFHLSFKSTHPAADTPLLGCVTRISNLLCSHLNFQWSCKAFTFPVFTVLKGALAENPEIMLIPCFPPTLTSSFHCCQLYFPNRSQIWLFIHHFPLSPT